MGGDAILHRIDGTDRDYTFDRSWNWSLQDESERVQFIPRHLGIGCGNQGDSSWGVHGHPGQCSLLIGAKLVEKVRVAIFNICVTPIRFTYLDTVNVWIEVVPCSKLRRRAWYPCTLKADRHLLKLLPRTPACRTSAARWDDFRALCLLLYHLQTWRW